MRLFLFRIQLFRLYSFKDIGIFIDFFSSRMDRIERKRRHLHVMHRLKEQRHDLISSVALIFCSITRAWHDVQPRCTSKCFAKCGFVRNEVPIQHHS